MGALLAIAMFHEELAAHLIGAGILMAIGVYFHLSEAHEHEHEHDAIEHEHRHTHDAHHQHPHSPDDQAAEPHSHWHRHVPRSIEQNDTTFTGEPELIPVLSRLIVARFLGLNSFHQPPMQSG
jgi:ABC-type nickel/cobalt efflux system permease component RcnA